MRREHWAWLGVFLLISVMIHLIIGWTSRSLGGNTPHTPPNQLVITLLPPPPAAKHVGLPAPKQMPAPAAKVAQRTQPERHVRLASVPHVRVAPRMVKRAVVTHRQVASTKSSVVTHAVTVPTEQPQITTSTPEIRIAQTPPTHAFFSGGGSPAPSPLHDGHGGAPAPETPQDDILWNGGGRGGAKLPKIAARAGGGGGLAFLSVHNPLGEVVPDETPGAGPGGGGGEGTGHGGGMGFGRMHGVGMALSGHRFAALDTAIGTGLGAGHGKRQGTHQPGGVGTGSETPGTGGLGTGYSSGNGPGQTAAFRPGLSDAPNQTADLSGDPPGALDRGIPFGDIPGLLGGGSASGGSGGLSGGGTLHMVYLLDVSGSMRVKNKTGKARDALKKALNELKRKDWFDIICFDAQTYPFAPDMQKATPANVARAEAYIDAMPLDQHPGTNMSQALGTALNMHGVTNIFLMSDGEPQWGGITDFTKLRQYVVQQNTRKIPIFTLALGVGKRFKGIALMQGIAQDNGGTFNYINLSEDTPTTTLP